MTAIELLDRVEAEFEALLLAIHLAPLDLKTRAELNKDLFQALNRASAEGQLEAIARVRDAFVAAIATGGEGQSRRRSLNWQESAPQKMEDDTTRKEHPNS